MWYLELFKEGLELDGIHSQGFNSLWMSNTVCSHQVSLLDQYINIFQFMANDIKQIINEYFLELYETPLKTVIYQLNDANGDLSDTQQTAISYGIREVL